MRVKPVRCMKCGKRHYIEGAFCSHACFVAFYKQNFELRSPILDKHNNPDRTDDYIVRREVAR